MPHTRFPRIVGFEVPPLSLAVDTVRDAPIVALLDAPPDEDWLAAFHGEIQSGATRAELASASVEGDRLFFFASEKTAAGWLGPFGHWLSGSTAAPWTAASLARAGLLLVLQFL